jgi:uncharacterized repeat protein (TIGR03943 family)
MNTVDRFIVEWLKPVLFGAWSAVLLYVLITQRYTVFLRPTFGWLLALAHFISMGFMIAALPVERPINLDTGGVLRIAVLLVPILYLISLPTDMLNSHVFTNRFVGTPEVTVTRAGKPATATPRRPLANRELTILDLLLNANQYNGRRVIFKGMMLHDEELKKYFDGQDTAVYRFLINCCAADALPLAVAVDSDQAQKVATDQWVRVEGIFHLRPIKGDAIPVVEDAAVYSVDAPDVAYLY